jgi:uncharacterized membrane protein
VINPEIIGKGIKVLVTEVRRTIVVVDATYPYVYNTVRFVLSLYILSCMIFLLVVLYVYTLK